MESRIFTPFLGMLLLCIGMINMVRCEYYNSESTPISCHVAAENVTHLHFYYFDIHTGKHPSAVVVARANLTPPSPFGTVFAINNPLREGSEETSRVIGNAQGLYVLMSSQDDPNKVTSLVMYVDYAFTCGEFNGSSISVVSRNPVTEPTRELAVVGGRGKFRMARGFAEIRNHSLNVTTGDGVIEYHVTLFHY